MECAYVEDEEESDEAVRGKANKENSNKLKQWERRKKNDRLKHKVDFQGGSC